MDGAVHADVVAAVPRTPPRYANGTVATAHFYMVGSQTVQLAADRSGNLYVLDDNHVVRKISASGQVSLLAGMVGREGKLDGTGAAASFEKPTAMVADANGNVYVASATSIRRITPAGVVTAFAGKSDGLVLPVGPGKEVTFGSIAGMAIDSAGNILVADSATLFADASYNGIRRVTPGGEVQAVKLSAPLKGAKAVAVDAAGNIVVFDYDRLLRFDASGQLLQTIGPEGGIDFARLRSIAFGPDGLLYMVEHVPINHDFKMSTLDSAGKVTVLHAGSVAAGLGDGALAVARFAGEGPLAANGMVFDTAGNLFVGDVGNHAIREITPDRQVTTYAGGWVAPPAFADGTGTAAAFGRIVGFGTDKAGNYYVADAGNCAIRKITPAHVVSTLAGAGGQCAYADSDGAAARFKDIKAMTQDADGNLIVAEATTVRKVSLAGAVTTVAGSPGTTIKRDGTGTAAAFYNLQGIASGPDGTLLVSDGLQVGGYDQCGPVHPTVGNTLRTISPQGVVVTVPGSEWQCGDTPGPLAAVGDLRFDAASRLYLLSQNYLAVRTPDGQAAYLLDSQGDRTAPGGTFGGHAGDMLAPDDAGNLFVERFGTVYKYGADRTLTRVLAATAAGNAAAITPDLPLQYVEALTSIGNGRFLASFDGQVVVLTLR
jgi:sugar lactone lactonase YvrE